MCYITKAQSYWGHRDHSSGCCQTTNPHYSWPSAAKMELISETLKRSLKLHRIKWTDKDRGCKTLCISHHSLTLAWVCLGLSEHSLTEKVSYWLMIFLSLSGIFICVQSCASISTLALAQQCPHDFAEPFQTSGSSILWCVLAEQTLHTVSLTSRKKDQREVEIFYWSSRSLCAFFVHVFCTCACPVYMHTHSRLLQCNKTHGSCEMSPLYYPQLLPGGAVALQSKTVWAACGTVSRSSISINPTELHPFLCTLHTSNNQVFDYSMDNSHFLLR